MAENIISQEKLLGAVDRILQKRSIAARCSDKQPMTGPLGIVLGMTRDHSNDKLKIARKEITPVMKTIRTEFSEEALQDLQKIYGEDIYDVLGHYVVDDLAYKIDADYITMIKARATSINALVFPAGDTNNSLWSVAQSVAITVNKSLADLPISDNRSAAGFAVVSSNIGALLAITLGVRTNEDQAEDDSPSYLGRIGGVDYYIDYTHPNDGTASVVFGIKGNGVSKGSTIFSPYTQEWMEANDASTGEKIYFLHDRTGMTINPLDDEYYNEGAGDSAFLAKFDVDLSGLQIYS